LLEKINSNSNAARDSGNFNNVKALGRDSVNTELNLEDPEKYNEDRRGSSHYQKGTKNFNKLGTSTLRV
jgi:hypothetical protein